MNSPLRDLGWELIPEHEAAPAVHVALDDALLQSVASGQRSPTLRFWAWASRAVIIGRFQSLRNEVDLEAAQAMGITVVRRMSGGGAMLVEPGSTITYSLYLPEKPLCDYSIRDSYELLDRWTVEIFRSLGIDAWYQPLNDITSSAGKIGGAAQVRKAGAILHHTTIAYEMNPADMLRVLRIGREKLSDKGIPSAARRVSPLRRQTQLPRNAIVDALVDGFREKFGLGTTSVRPEEQARAQQLLESRYGTETWTQDLP